MPVKQMKVGDGGHSDQRYPRVLLMPKIPRKHRPKSGASEEEGGSIERRTPRGRFFPGYDRTMHTLAWMPPAPSVWSS